MSTAPNICLTYGRDRSGGAAFLASDELTALSSINIPDIELHHYGFYPEQTPGPNGRNDSQLRCRGESD